MSGLNLPDLKRLIVAPALTAIGLYSPAACNLVVGTAAVESDCSYLKQIGAGPALGLWQMEPATEADIWANVINPSKALKLAINGMLCVGNTTSQLIGNLPYAAAMCRLKYHQSTEPLPTEDDADAMAMYWKRIYNTDLGAGVVDPQHVISFHFAINA